MVNGLVAEGFCLNRDDASLGMDQQIIKLYMMCNTFIRVEPLRSGQGAKHSRVKGMGPLSNARNSYFHRIWSAAPRRVIHYTPIYRFTSSLSG